MKKKTKFTALALTACMSASLLAGCGNDAQETTQSSTTGTIADSQSSQTTSEEETVFDTSEHVVLTVYCIGDEGGIHAKEHLDLVNKVLTEKINAEIEPIMVSWGDYKTKLPMVWASGEAYDLTYTSNWTNYFKEADRGAFMDISELFPTYAPLTYAEHTEKDYLETTKVKGNLYMVPNDKPDYTTFMYNYREDLRKKYNCPEIVDYATLKTYLQAIKENEPAMTPLANNSSEGMITSVALNDLDWSRSIDDASGVMSYDLNDPTHVFNVAETPEYEEQIRRARDYYEKGYWSQSIMAETTAAKELFMAGQTAVYLANVSNSNGVYQDIQSNHPDWEIGIWSSDIAASGSERVAPANNGMAVGAYSKNPERAMMFIELMYQDPEVYSIVMNGIEGVTFEKDEATMTKWIPEGVDPGEIALKNLGMGFGSQKFELGSKNDSPIVTKLKENYEAVGIFPNLAGFAIDQDTIAAELAALKSVYTEYKIPLEKGVLDVDKGLATLKEKLKSAGIDKVLEEVNKQIEGYLATQN